MRDDTPAFDGTLMWDDQARDQYAQDYGQIVHQRPRLVLRPGSVEDVVRMVRFARRRGFAIAPRGQGHQPFGQAQVRDGIVIDMRSLQTLHSVSPQRIDVDAGADWCTVVEAAISHGATPPVLPAYLGLTVGGTLSVGGIGPATFRHGAQIDQVSELSVVTGDGSVVTCSRLEHADLFEAVLAGQGQVAIITRAALRLAPAQSMVREYVLPYSDLSSLLTDQAALLREPRFDGVVAMIAPSPRGWSFALDVYRQYAPGERPDDIALTAGLTGNLGSLQTRDVEYGAYVNALTNVPSTQCHADLGLFIPGSKAQTFLTAMLPRLCDEDLGSAMRMRVFHWDRKNFSHPLFRAPVEDTFVYLAMLRAETDDPSMVARMLAGNRTLFESVRELGGTLYPYSALVLSHEDWRRHYAEAWQALALAKQRYDPGNVFASGPNLFR